MRSGIRRSIIVVLLGSSLVLVGCGRLQSSSGVGATGSVAPRASSVLARLAVVGPNVAWAHSEVHIFRTLDGGRHWVASTNPGTIGERVDATAFFTDKKAVVTLVGPSAPVAVARTEDGGISWSRVSVPLSDAGSAGNTSLSFVSDAIGWLSIEHQHNSGVIGSSELFATTNGGRTWQSIGTPALPSTPVGPIRFISRVEGWGLDDPLNRLYRTMDGGLTWSEVSLTLPSSLQAQAATLRPTMVLPSFFGAEGVLPVFFDSPSTRIAVFYSSTDGQNWAPGQALSDPEFAEYGGGLPLPTSVMSATVWAVASGPGLYITSDRGRTWRHTLAPNASGARDLAMPTLSQLWVSFTDIHCVSKGVGCTTVAGVERSDDGGTTWSHVEPATS